MPFGQRVVPERLDVYPIIHARSGDVLMNAAASNMVGLLSQLSTVAQLAGEIFSDLLKHTDRNVQRIRGCGERVRSLEKRVPEVENQLATKAPSEFYDNPWVGKEFQRRDKLTGLLFRRDRAPVTVNQRRDFAEGMPDIGEFDCFNPDKQPAITKYSNPRFFVEEWLKAEKLRIEEQRAKRKARKKRKRGKSKVERVKTKKILKLKKTRYNEQGVKIEDTGDAYTEVTDLLSVHKHGGSKPMAAMSASTRKGSLRRRGGSTHARVQPPVSVKREADASTKPKPASATAAVQSSHAPATVRPLASDSGPKVPAVPRPPLQPASDSVVHASSGGPPAIPSVAVSEFEEVKSDEPMDDASVPEVYDVVAASRRRAQDEAKRAEEAAAAKAKVVTAPARMNFLSQIQEGTKLKHAETARIPIDNRSKLLQQIGGGAAALKKVTRAELEEDRRRRDEEAMAQAEEGSIFAILQRRKLIADDSSDESGSDWGSESD